MGAGRHGGWLSLHIQPFGDLLVVVKLSVLCSSTCPALLIPPVVGRAANRRLLPLTLPCLLGLQLVLWTGTHGVQIAGPEPLPFPALEDHPLQPVAVRAVPGGPGVLWPAGPPTAQAGSLPCRLGSMGWAGTDRGPSVAGAEVPRRVWAGMLGCARALGLDLKQLGAWEQLSQSVTTWVELLLSCLHSLMLAALLLLLLTWRLCWKAHHCSLGWLRSKALLQKHVMLESLALLKHLYWWVESMIAPISWHLAYLITWTTCLASHLLQAAFEHTAQLAQAQAQQAEPQEASRPLYESPFLESLDTKAGPVLPEHGNHGE